MTLKYITQRHKTHLRILILTFSALLVLNCTGCMNKAAQDEKDIPQEELYIDAKLGFSVTHPLSWKRIKVPVSSPDFRDDTVKWNIPTAKEPGTMSIRVYPAQEDPTDLPKLIERFLEGRAEVTSVKTEAFKHAIGEANTTILTSKTSTELLFVINGAHNAYILSFSVASGTFKSNSSLYKRVAESFREL